MYLLGLHVKGYAKSRLIQQCERILILDKPALDRILFIVQEAVTVGFGHIFLSGDQTQTGGNGQLGFQHTAYHAGDSVGFGDRIDLGSRIQAAAFHQLDVENIGRLQPAGSGRIHRSMDGFVQHDLDSACFLRI